MGEGRKQKGMKSSLAFSILLHVANMTNTLRILWWQNLKYEDFPGLGSETPALAQFTRNFYISLSAQA